MRIAHFVPLIACKAGYERNVSGHVQVPLHAMKLLADAGHEVHLITNPPYEGRPVLPAMMPDNLTVHYVTDGRVRAKVVDGVASVGRGVKPGRLLKQWREIRGILRDREIDVLHAWGYHRTMHFAALHQRFGNVPVVATLFGPPLERRLERMLARQWGRMTLVTATEFVADSYRALGLDVGILRHGPVRDLVAELGGAEPDRADRVLFWRDASVENGADVVLAAYDALAPRYPDVRFELAIRPYWDEVPGLDEIVARHDNVHLFRFPYADGITLPKLLVGSLCVPLMFTSLSIHPQLSIAETMAAGVPVIGSDFGSTPELVRTGENGAIVRAGDAAGATEALDRMLADRPATRAMGRNAAESIARDWSWDGYAERLAAVYEGVS